MISAQIKDLFSTKLVFIARIIALIAIAALPFSHYWVNKLMIFTVLLTLISGVWLEKWQMLKTSKSVIIGFLFLILLMIGLTYSHATFSHSMVGFTKYTKILGFFAFFLLFTDVKWRRYAIDIFIIAMSVGLLISYINHYHLINLVPIFGTPNNSSFFIDTISYSVQLALVCFLIFHKMLTIKHSRIIYSILLVLFLYYLLFINIERTGYLVFLALFALTAWQKLNRKFLSIALLAVVVIFTALYFSSTNFHTRINAIAEDVHSYQQGNHETSIGYRLAFLKYSFKLVKQHPIIGSGTGSFKTVYAKTGGPRIYPTIPLGDPHNEYMLIWVQLGTIGLLCFLVWLFVQWRETGQLPIPEHYFAQGLILTFIINSFCNVSLTVNSTGALYTFFLGVFLAANYNKLSNQLKL